LFKQINNYNEINNNTKNKNNTNDSFSHNKNNKELGFYLAGLIEADGSIIIPRSNSNNTPTISISFHEDDKPLAKKICKILGFGSIELIPLSKAVKIQIRGKYSIINTLTLINGKFRTPKIEKLNSLINYVNENWNNDLLKPIIIHPIDDSSLNSNSWLSGFSVGDANFYINISWPIKNKYG